ncbi:MAG: hypothetical protein JWO10_532 [Microbacteriaceae bacterium]|nr:hypothetical protein [Microbacteriaceae bacterium]
MARVAQERDRTEHRWPAVGSVIVALALYALLPSGFLPILRYSVVAVGVLLLIPMIVINPVRMKTQTKLSRGFSIGLTTLLAVANHVALVQLVILLVHAKKDSDGTLLVAAAQVWITHVIVYALIYWEMDRGGPVVRTTVKRDELPEADIRFPQDEDHDAIVEVAKGSSAKSDWTAGFVDYAYFSASNTMAFSPPDAMPLTARMKTLVGLQAFAGFIILVLVIARAVSLLG